MKALTVKNKVIRIKTTQGFITIKNGKVAEYAGGFTPVEKKKAIKIFYAIINK